MTERKYRQSGYQDSQSRGGRSGSEGRGFDGPARLPGAPTGRGAERDREEVFRCKACGEKNPVEVVSDSACVKCHAALHACSQCRHFDGASQFQCRKPIPAPIAAKSRQNDCALYEPTITLDLKGRSPMGRGATPDDARSAFDKLFGKK